MQRLGYTRYVAQGGDWGNAVSEVMALQQPAGLLGISTNMSATVPPEIAQAMARGEAPPATLSADERRAWDQLDFFYKKGLGYANEMALRPQTLYALADSPVGLAAWMLDHDARSEELIVRVFNGGREGLSRNDVLDNITLYWLTNTAVSSARLYWSTQQLGGKGGFFDARGVQIPVAVMAYPDEIYQAPQSWAERAYPKLLRYNRLPKGGHFAAWEANERFHNLAEDETMRRNRAAEGGASRRDFLVTSAAAVAAAAMPAAPLTADAQARATAPARTQGARSVNTITTKDGVEIFYKDWGKGQPIVFSHGWPLSADDWDTQMLFFLEHGYRVIAHDRRGHGRSTQVGGGHDMDHYADDLAALTAHLNLKGAVHVGHSTGGGEVVHYLARHGQSRVAKAVIISAVPPLMVKTATNPGGLPKEVFDGLQAQVAANRAQFYYDFPAGPFYGYNRPGAKPSQGVIWNWWRQGMMGGAKAHYDGIVAFSQTDFTEDLKKITVPVQVMHGDDDQIVPYADAGPLSAKLLRNSTLKTYKGFPHGMPTTEAETINADLLSFLKA